MDKNEQVKVLFEGAMSLYNTIDIETNNAENNYKDAETEIKKVLNGEEALFVPEDDSLAGMLFQYINLGYAVCGLKYLEMILNNKNISVSAVGYALQVLNNNTEKLNKYIQLYGELPEESEPTIKEQEFKGISE